MKYLASYLAGVFVMTGLFAYFYKGRIIKKDLHE